MWEAWYTLQRNACVHGASEHALVSTLIHFPCMHISLHLTMLKLASLHSFHVIYIYIYILYIYIYIYIYI